MKNRTYYPGSGYIREITLPLDVVKACSHAGQCDDDIERALLLPEVAKEMAKIDPQALVKELKEYGAWTDEQLADHDENIKRMLWISAGAIADEIHEESKIRKSASRALTVLILACCLFLGACTSSYHCPTYKHVPKPYHYKR